MIVVRKLEAGDDLSAFQSSNKHLNRWVRKYGLANQHIYGVTYVAIDDDHGVVGYVTVASNLIDAAKVGKTGGPAKWPALLIARLATAGNRQGQGIGKHLMRHVFELAKNQYESTGCAVVTVDSKPESVGFYRKFLFEEMPVIDGGTQEQVAMYLEIGTVLAAIDGM